MSEQEPKLTRDDLIFLMALMDNDIAKTGSSKRLRAKLDKMLTEIDDEFAPIKFRKLRRNDESAL